MIAAKNKKKITQTSSLFTVNLIVQIKRVRDQLVKNLV